MDRDIKAQITIRDLHKMTEKDVKLLAGWIRERAAKLEAAISEGQPWLVKHKNYEKIFYFRLMK